MTGLETVALGAAIAGTALSTIGTLKQGADAENIANYNAKVKAQDAQLAREQALREAELKRREVGRILSRQRLLSSTSGLGMTGSLLTLADTTAREGAADERMILYAGELQRARALSEGRGLQAEGKAARQTSLIGAAGRAGVGASSIYLSYKGV